MKENNNNHSLCIGITGCFGTGKSSVTGIIAEYGYPVIFTDDIAKRLMNENEAIRIKLKAEFGDDVYSADGTINRKFISDIVFNGTDDSKQKLSSLNTIVHPYVIDEMIRLVDEYEEKGKQLIFVESALIYEAELEDGFDYIINVSSDIDVIIKRAGERNIPESEVMKRLNEQIPVTQKAGWADFNIDNNAGLDELKKSVLTILEIIKAMV